MSEPQRSYTADQVKQLVDECFNFTEAVLFEVIKSNKSRKSALAQLDALPVLKTTFCKELDVWLK